MLRDGFGDKPLFHVLVAEWTADDGPTVDTTVDPTKPSTSMPHNERIVGHALFFYTYSTWEGKCLFLEDLCVREEYRSESVPMRQPILCSLHRSWYWNSSDAGMCKGKGSTR